MTIRARLMREYRQIRRLIERRDTIRASNRKIKLLLDSGRSINLELGSGPRKGRNGWVSSDIKVGADLVIDLQEPIPFPDNTVDKVYSSHLLEHFQTRQIEFILDECRRVLKSRGVLSLCVPNAEIYLNAYINPEGFDPSYFCRHKPAYRYHSKIDYVNYIAYMNGNHFHLFDRENLIALLNAAGFREVRSRDFDPELDLSKREYESLYVQAMK